MLLWQRIQCEQTRSNLCPAGLCNSPCHGNTPRGRIRVGNSCPRIGLYLIILIACVHACVRGGVLSVADSFYTYYAEMNALQLLMDTDTTWFHSTDTDTIHRVKIQIITELGCVLWYLVMSKLCQLVTCWKCQFYHNHSDGPFFQYDHVLQIGHMDVSTYK